MYKSVNKLLRGNLFIFHHKAKMGLNVQGRNNAKLHSQKIGNTSQFMFYEGSTALTLKTRIFQENIEQYPSHEHRCKNL